MPTLDGLDHFVLTVTDLAATIAFYSEALGMQHLRFTVADGTTRHAMTFGSYKINLHPEDAPFSPHAASPTAGTGDFCVLTTDDLGDWQAHLRAAGIAIEEAPVKRTGAQGTLISIYIRDPDGNLIEIANYL
ncbi:VOC family protein [Algicella marina]|uniref:VOC family protein n=1 Tax=Algicella marina TaxID=2683284 RepID=A0A6P1T2T3_9RHOB|nr:VOC family protein [Algicella marina]QHQ36041.1 VOC family protein [Algicella marina]